MKIARLEEMYLSFFKIVLLAILTVALLASVVLVLKGSLEFLTTEKAPLPAKKADRVTTPEQKPKVAIDDFLNSLTPKDAPKQDLRVDEIKKKSDDDSKIKIDAQLDKMVEDALVGLWVYLSAFQEDCQLKDKIDKTTLFKEFPRQVMLGWFKRYGQDFMNSQDGFEKALLQNPKVIEYCKAKEGKSGIFTRSLDWHADQYAKKLQEIKTTAAAQIKKYDEYDIGEIRRVAQFETMETSRVIESRAKGMISYIAAGSAFAIFMSLILILILSKIEYSIRELKISFQQRESIS
jgi:hypothetical protein